MYVSHKIEYIKDSKRFARSEDANSSYKSILEMGQNPGKTIFFKYKSPHGRKKIAFSDNLWMSKKPVVPVEIIISEPFRILLGTQCSPKYRISCDGSSSTMVMTKLLPGFITWAQAEKNMTNLTPDESVSLEYHGDRESEYGKNVLKYLKTTSELENFERMVAVCLLFSKDDLHSENWGIVEVEGKKYAATVDHGSTLDWTGFDICKLLKRHGHRKEKLVTAKFVAVCRDVLADYELKKDLLKQVMAECIDAIKSVIDHVPMIDSVMEIIEGNKNKLSTLCYQIEAELAIMQGECNALRRALINLPSHYFPKDEDISYSLIISMQNYRDGFLAGLTLRGLIKVRTIADYDKVWQYCSYLDGKLVLNEKVKISADESKIESELLEIYDEVKNDKSEEIAHWHEFSF